MNITDLITELQRIRAQYGGIQVWIPSSISIGVRVAVTEMHDTKTGQPIEKIVTIELKV